MQVLSVSQVNTYIKALLDEAQPLNRIYVSGEISNFKLYYKSGHMYFTLKDSSSQLKCVMFSSGASRLKFNPCDGMKVLCFGRISVYDRDGTYQLYVNDMQPDGAGALAVAFEQLKEKLDKEGLFSQSHKKPIPRYPKKIGVITSNMGAAVEDIKNIISRRYPLCDIVIVPTVVQGETASDDIVKSIQLVDSMADIDTVIVGRGGGSLEDLWAFNTEEVARAVYNCKKPIISAVGHETDFTICDFVADLRAPTPSAAAELAVPDKQALLTDIANYNIALDRAINGKIEKYQNKLDIIKHNSALSDSQRIFDNISRCVTLRQSEMKNAFERLIARCEKETVRQSELKKAVMRVIEKNESKIAESAASLDALSPLAVLARGYSITTGSKGVLSKTDDAVYGEDITVRLSDGEVKATVKGIEKYEQ